MKILGQLGKNIVIFSIIGGAILAGEGFAQQCPSSQQVICGNLHIIYNQSTAVPGWKVDFTTSDGSVNPANNTPPPASGGTTQTRITYCASPSLNRVSGDVKVTDPARETRTFRFNNSKNAQICEFVVAGCTGAVAFNKDAQGKKKEGSLVIGPFESFQDAINQGQNCWSP